MRSVWLGQMRHWWDGILAALACTALWIFGISLVGDFRIDDAYITFSYSRNLADGRGLIYGYDMKVEGYSNFLWMVLCALGERVGAGSLATARFFGHASFALLLASSWFVVRRYAGKFAALSAVVCLACATDLHRAIQSGLESVAFAALIGAGLWHYVIENPEKRRWSGLWFSLAALTRIDGFIALGLILGWDLARVLVAEKRPPALVWARWATTALVPVAAYWIFRVSYYGLLFPLPYYAKASLGIEMEQRGAAYVWRFFEESGLWIFLLLGVMGLARTKEKAFGVVAAFTASLTGYVIYVGGDWMPFYRMLLPLYAPLAVFFGLGVGELVPEFSALKKWRTALAGTAVLLATAFVGAHLSQNWLMTPHEERKIGEAEHSRSHTKNLLKAYPFVQALIREPGRKLVTDYGGVFAYATKATVIEMWGLCNKDIALKGNTEGIVPIYGKTCVPCYADFQPDYFHVVVPLLRDRNAFRSKHQVIGQIFQGWAIDRVIDLKNNYRPGRVTRVKSGETLWFLERIREGESYQKRTVGAFEIDYPRLR